LVTKKGGVPAWAKGHYTRRQGARLNLKWDETEVNALRRGASPSGLKRGSKARKGDGKSEGKKPAKR